MAALVKAADHLESCTRGWLFASASILNDELRVTLPVWGWDNYDDHLKQLGTGSETFDTGFKFSPGNPDAYSIEIELVDTGLTVSVDGTRVAQWLDVAHGDWSRYSNSMIFHTGSETARTEVDDSGATLEALPANVALRNAVVTDMSRCGAEIGCTLRANLPPPSAAAKRRRQRRHPIPNPYP